jgi:glyoxylase-like metal-dependent hydrolase (beta-lactamase superfamily II)
MDHAGGATELAEALGAPITGPVMDEKFLLDDLVAAGARFGLNCRNCTPDRWLEQGDVVVLGGEEFEIRHCPGHTPGSVVYLNHRLNIGLVGDVLFKGSIGRTDLGDYGNHEQLINSIRTQLLTLPDEFAFISGHGPTSTIGAERHGNPFLRID